MRVLGIILIIAGILMFVFRGFNFVTEKKIVDAGPLQISKKENNTVSWPYYAGAVAVIAGIAVLYADRKKV